MARRRCRQRAEASARCNTAVTKAIRPVGSDGLAGKVRGFRPSSEAGNSQGGQREFSLFEPDAKQVSLCGDFNEWSPNATPMKWKEGGRWAATVALAPGRYQYKFVADGRWMHDPAARENVSTQHGTLNSVVEVRA